MMELSSGVVLQGLGLSDAAALFAPHWAASVASYPVDGPPCLVPERIVAHATYAALPAEVLPHVLRTAGQVRANRSLSLLCWHCGCLLFEQLDYNGCREWPDLEHVLPGQTGLFYFLIALEMVPLTQQVHRELGVEESQTRRVCEGLAVHLQRCLSATGRYGTQQRLLPWLRHYTTGSLYRLGRFQYMQKPFRGALSVYRRRGSRVTVALADPGLLCSPQGWLLTDLSPESEGAWLTGGWESGDAVSGHPVHPSGCILPRVICLEKSTWELVLSPADSILEIHIPPGGGMTPEVAVDSLRAAVSFFRSQFPERPFRGLSCLSWVFNPRFGEILPPGANIRRLQEEVYLFPVPSGRKNGLYFIFGQDDIDLATAPRDTSIRRVLIAELEQGNPLLTGGMFILNEDLEHFGTQLYRRSWPWD